jgi:hypothetical protein
MLAKVEVNATVGVLDSGFYWIDNDALTFNINLTDSFYDGVT